MMYGVFGHPGRFWQQGFHLGDLGVNAVFIGSGEIDQEEMGLPPQHAHLLTHRR